MMAISDVIRLHGLQVDMREVLKVLQLEPHQRAVILGVQTPPPL